MAFHHPQELVPAVAVQAAIVILGQTGVAKGHQGSGGVLLEINGHRGFHAAGVKRYPGELPLPAFGHLQDTAEDVAGLSLQDAKELSHLGFQPNRLAFVPGVAGLLGVQLGFEDLGGGTGDHALEVQGQGLGGLGHGLLLFTFTDGWASSQRYSLREPFPNCSQ